MHRKIPCVFALYTQYTVHEYGLSVVDVCEVHTESYQATLSLSLYLSSFDHSV